jgi:predicted ATPase
MDAYTRAYELCNRLGGETPQFFPALRGLWTGYRARGQMRTARDLADRLVAIARRGGDQALLLEAHHAQWTTQYALGEWRSVCEHTAQGLALYRPEHFSHAFVYGGHDSAVCATTKEGISLWMLGFPDRALARSQESVALARKLSHPASVLHALYHTTVCHHLRRDAAALREKTEKLLQMAHELLPSWIPYANLQMSLISALGGEQQARAGMTTIQEARLTELSGDVEGSGFSVCLFAGVCGLSGEVDVGLNALERAIAEAAATGIRLWESELHRLVGNFLLGSAAPDLDRSEAHYLRALEVAREQQALSLELRASTALAHLWADRGERQKACDLLAPIYIRFTEGFGTRDLIDAKALLNTLG